MIMTPNGEAVLMRGDWTPAKLSLGDEVIATPITVTATGEGGVTIPNTYSDSCKLVKVTGKCAQTVTTVGKNLADGAVRFMQIPDYYIWEQQNWIVPESGQTYYIGFSETFAQLNVIAKFADGTTESKAASFGATGKWFTVTDNIVSVQGYTLTFSETVAKIQITAYGQEGNGFGADVVGQLELGSTATDYEPVIPDSPTPEYPSEIRCVGGAVTTVGKNLADGAVRHMQTDYYIWEQQNWIVPESGQTYYIGFSETFAQLNVIAKFADGTTESKAASFGATGKWFTVTDNIVSVQGYTLTFSETVAEIQITAYGQEGNGFGADVVGQLELGTTATTYLPYYTPTTIDLPDLYAVGDMADVMWIDQGQQRAWVERHIDSDILSTSAVVDEQSQAVLATPTIEELEYTALPTYPRHTQLVVSDSDVAPAIEVTALVYREEDS